MDIIKGMFNNNIGKVLNILKSSSEIVFKSESLEESETGWNYEGNGKVRSDLSKVSNSEDSCFIIDFIEEIIIKDDIRFMDRKKWVFFKDNIDFFRFRNGYFEKIFSFISNGENFKATEKYMCHPDEYSGELSLEQDCVILRIYIKGDRKNEVLEYCYS